MSYFKISHDKQGQYRWTFHVANDRILADSGESFTRRAMVEANIKNVQSLVGIAPIHNITIPGEDGHHAQGGKPEFEIYLHAAKEYRWQLQNGEDRIIAKSREGFNARTDCVRDIELFKKDAPNAEVKDKTRSDECSHEEHQTAINPRGRRFA